MSRFLSLALGALAAIAVAEAPVLAQPAAALGHPLPDGNLAAGTISVRVIAGSPQAPVTGTDVTLTVNGEARNARTDAAGRATFAGLPPGATVQATIQDADGKPVQSDSFPVPEQGGARVMLTTKPFEGGGGMAGGPMMGGGGMPEPRAMSGQPRPERADPAGTYTVRITYNDLKMVGGKLVDPSPPVGQPVYLVAYSADDSIRVTEQKTLGDGHVSFSDLDVTGGTSYFVLANLPRGQGTDRLIAVPAVPDPQGGMRAVLSGDKRDATTPPIDDYGKLVPDDGIAVAADKVRVTLDGVPVDAASMVSLIDAATGKPIAMLTPHEGPPDPSQMTPHAEYQPNKDLPAGSFEVDVKGGPGTTMDPMPGVTVRLVDDKDQPIAGVEGATGMDGKVVLKTAPAAGVKAVIVLNGKEMGSQPVDLTAGGGVLSVTANWANRGRPEAIFSVPTKAGQVMYAETQMGKQLFRSLPFLAAPEKGVHASIYVYPRTMFTFSAHSFLEDQLLAVQGTFEVTNYAWAPYRAGPDGMLIKLPAHHKGGVIAPQDQNDVSVAQGEGFRIQRPIPPGGRKFRAGFSMPVEDGTVDMRLDLPLGTWQSEMEIRQTDGMRVQMTDGITGETRTASTGEPWFVIDTITIERGKAFTLTISGLPADAAWKTWVPRAVGVLVLGMILGGIGFALLRRPEAASARPGDGEARRQKLLDELVALDREGKQDTRRREQILDELERLWGAP